MIRPPAPSRIPNVHSSLPEIRSLTGFLFTALIFFSIAVVMPVSAGPVVSAAFSADPMSGTVPLEVHFTDTSSGATSWSWFFDDGSSATQQNPVHTFTEPGDYDVSLVINGGESTAHKTITVFAPLYGGRSGTSDDPFQISTRHDIIYLSTDSGNWSKYFVLINDLSLSPGSPEETIGNEDLEFTGNFDGQDHTISDFTMNKSSSDFIGLFGHIGSGAEIRNLGVDAGDDGVHGSYYVGVLAGYNYGVITNCLAVGNVTAFAAGGGLVGFNEGILTNCSATGSASASDASAGGLVGSNTGTLTGCSASGSANSYFYAGGLVGSVFSGTLTNCYATGSATVSGYYAGGLVGDNDGGTLTNCYATGNATADNYNAGGLVGRNKGLITNCYAAGTGYAGKINAGGLVGYDDGTISNCYRHYNDGDNYNGTYVSDLTTFRDIVFLTGDEPANGLNWSTDIISTDADSSKVWRAFTYKGRYPVFQWQSYGTGTITVTSSPSGADISLNGVATGRATNITVPDLPEGEYMVTVSRAEYTSTPENVSVTLTGGGAEEVSFVLEGNETTKVLNLSAGWNMISVPVENATITLPAEAGAVYRYNGNIYESVADLADVSPGEGLWTAATGPCNITFTGIAVDSYTEPASAGWNMIGSCSEEIESFGNHLSSDPAGKVSGQIYTYDPAEDRYVTPVSCTPGCGYWVSVSEGCEICLS